MGTLEINCMMTAVMSTGAIIAVRFAPKLMREDMLYVCYVIVLNLIWCFEHYLFLLADQLQAR